LYNYLTLQNNEVSPTAHCSTSCNTSLSTFLTHEQNYTVFQKKVHP